MLKRHTHDAIEVFFFFFHRSLLEGYLIHWEKKRDPKRLPGGIDTGVSFTAFCTGPSGVGLGLRWATRWGSKY